MAFLKTPALDFSFETPTIQTKAVSEVIFYILFPKLTLIFFPPSMRYRQYFPSIGTLPRMCEETKILNSQVMRNPKQPISHIRTCILYLIGLPSTLGSLGNYSWPVVWHFFFGIVEKNPLPLLTSFVKVSKQPLVPERTLINKTQ